MDKLVTDIAITGVLVLVLLLVGKLVSMLLDDKGDEDMFP